MEQQVYFSQMFPDYEPPEALKSVLSQAAIVAADIDPERGLVSVVVECDTYIPKHQLDSAALNIQGTYGLKSMELMAVHPTSELSAIEPEEIMGLFVEQNSMNRASLAGAAWSWEGETLNVQLRGNGIEELQKADRKSVV